MFKSVAILLLVLSIAANTTHTSSEDKVADEVHKEQGVEEDCEETKSLEKRVSEIDDTANTTHTSSEDKVADEVHKGKEQGVEEDSEETKIHIRIPPGTFHHIIKIFKVAAHCLDCVCGQLTRGCTRKSMVRSCSSGICGPLGITFPFWLDAFNHKLDGQSAEGVATLEKEWKECSLNPICIFKMAQRYFNRYHVDCNGDGKVDCVDYAEIHMLGPFGCVKKDWEPWKRGASKTMLHCLASDEPGPFETELKRLEGIAGHIPGK